MCAKHTGSKQCKMRKKSGGMGDDRTERRQKIAHPALCRPRAS